MARGSVQRVGASFYALLLLFSTIAVCVGAAYLGRQVMEAVGGIFGWVLATMLTLALFFVGCVLAFIAFRLLKGVRRSFHTQK
jgi:hypothetical protein